MLYPTACKHAAAQVLPEGRSPDMAALTHRDAPFSPSTPDAPQNDPFSVEINRVLYA